MVRLGALTLDEVDGHRPGRRQVDLAERQPVKAPPRGQVGLSEQIPGRYDGSVVDAVQDALIADTLRLFGPDARAVVAVVVIAVILPSGRRVARGVEDAAARELTNRLIPRGEVADPWQRRGGRGRFDGRFWRRLGSGGWFPSSASGGYGGHQREPEEAMSRRSFRCAHRSPSLEGGIVIHEGVNRTQHVHESCDGPGWSG